MTEGNRQQAAGSGEEGSDQSPGREPGAGDGFTAEDAEGGEKTPYTCPICDRVRPSVSWTDTHGVAQCLACGCPLRLFFYEGQKRVDREPECRIDPEWIARIREYHASTKRKIPSGFSIGCFGDAQEVCTLADAEAFSAWLKAERAKEAANAPAPSACAPGSDQNSASSATSAVNPSERAS